MSILKNAKDTVIERVVNYCVEVEFITKEDINKKSLIYRWLLGVCDYYYKTILIEELSNNIKSSNSVNLDELYDMSKFATKALSELVVNEIRNSFPNCPLGIKNK